MLTYQNLKNIVENKGYSFFDNSKYNLNLIGERTSLRYDDMFHDNFYCAYRDDKECEQILQLPFSTLPGSYWLNHPPTVEGVKGCAVIQPGQYLSVYTFIDDYVTWLNYPFLYQTGTMNYWRDPGTELEVDDMIPALQKNYKTNFHRGSNPGITGMTNYNWSEGCQIMEEPYFKQLLPLLRLSVIIWGNKFSYTLLESKDFYNFI